MAFVGGASIRSQGKRKANLCKGREKDAVRMAAGGSVSEDGLLIVGLGRLGERVGREWVAERGVEVVGETKEYARDAAVLGGIRPRTREEGKRERRMFDNVLFSAPPNGNEDLYAYEVSCLYFFLA